MAKRVMKTFDVYWSPTGQKIATVKASTMRAAKSKAPSPYRRYKGEMYVEDRGMAQNPSAAKRISKALKKWVKSQGNPARAVTLKNFTGTIRKNKNGTVSILGRGKTK